MRHFVVLVLAALTLASPAGAQADSAQARPVTPDSTLKASKQILAVRIPNSAVRIDGKLDESAWEQVSPTTDFLQTQPVEGGPPTDQLEIRLAYDDDALYVGTRVRTRDRRPMVVRWEYRPGSTLFLVWQQDRSASEQHGRRIQLGDVLDGFSAAGNNFFAVKATFWMPVK